MGAELRQGIEIGRVDEAERRIARYGDGASCKQSRHRRLRRRRGKIHRPTLQIRPIHLPQGRHRQCIGRGVQPSQRIRQFVCRHQAQVALGQQGCGLSRRHRIGQGHARQGAQPVGRLTQPALQHLGMALTRHAVGQNACPGQVRLVMPQAIRQRAKGAGHGRRIDNRQHRHAKVPRQIGRAGFAIEQAHDTFDENQVGVLRRSVQARGAILGAVDPQIKRMHGRAAGELMPVRIEKIRPALEDAHAPALPGVQARQGRYHRGLALARGWGRHQQCGATGGGALHYRRGSHFRPI